MTVLYCVIVGVVALGLGGVGGYFILNKIQKTKIGNTTLKVNQMLEEAKQEAKTHKKEAIIEAKEEIIKMKNDANKELVERRAEISRNENRLQLKEDNLDRREEILEKRIAANEDERKLIEVKSKEVEKTQLEIIRIKDEASKTLEKISGLSKEEAKSQLIKSIEADARKEAGIIVREIEQEARNTAEKEARNIVALAIQKCATDHTAEVTLSTVALPNDEMKGRIIGREGRNIASIEAATGTELIVDDTPEAIFISCFDPIRREVARLTLEKLINDGRIHPARIEEIVEKVKKDIEFTIKDTGENATFEAGVYSLHPELIKLLGRLKYRTSYGQNALKHSLETSYLAGLIAGELGGDVSLAKRGGLLHDIGKAVDFEIEGTHVSIGVELARKYKENEAVVNCIEAHHGAVEFASLEAICVQVADAISSARPGARKESMENYVKRLKQLEDIALSFDGIASAYALSAGREVRIVVKPEVVDDSGIIILAKEIAKKIESEMQYPGQIKVNIIRETRGVDYAS